ncbi:MAG TPA: glycoside hydrolase family protein [Caulobacteraceae bacterium]|jgi:lysozyme
MRPRYSISRSAVELIMAFEGFRAEAARLDDGRWTIGYGHTRTARQGVRITEADAEALLLYDLIQVGHAVNEHVFAPVNQNQYDALVSFVFNIGEAAFRTSPTLRRLNEGRPLDAALAMELWRKADLDGERIVVDALVRRRAAEKALFLKPVDGWGLASTPVLPPKIDYDVMALIPLTSPVLARPATDGERAFAERDPTAPPPAEPYETPSVTAAAAQSVIERLEAILGEPSSDTSPADAPHAFAQPSPATDADEPTAALSEAEAEAGPAPTPDAEPRLTLAQVRRSARVANPIRPRANLLGPLGVVLLAALGVGLLALAAIWGFQGASEHVLGVSPRTAGLTMGFFGVICFGLAAYFILDRLGLPREKRD